jgi:hypothetical protein
LLGKRLAVCWGLLAAGMTVTDIGKRLGELWKEVSEEDKKKFYELAEKDKERYNKENAKYNASKASA